MSVRCVCPDWGRLLWHSLTLCNVCLWWGKGTWITGLMEEYCFGSVLNPSAGLLSPCLGIWEPRSKSGMSLTHTAGNPKAVSETAGKKKIQASGCMTAPTQLSGINPPTWVAPVLFGWLRPASGACSWAVREAFRGFRLLYQEASLQIKHECEFQAQRSFLNAMCYWISPVTHSSAKAVAGQGHWCATPLAACWGCCHMVFWFKYLR